MGEKFVFVFVFVFGLLALFCFKDQFCQALVHGQCMTELILKIQDVFSWWSKTHLSVKAFILFLFFDGIMK